MNREEKEMLQEAIEQAVAVKRCVIIPDNGEGYLIRAYLNQFKIDDVYWKGKDGKIYRVFMEIREVGKYGIQGLFVVGAQSLDNFSSGVVSMIRPENRYFPEDDNELEERGCRVCSRGEDNESKRLMSGEETRVFLSDSLVGVLSNDYVMDEDEPELRWVIDEYGVARCPHCNTPTIEDEYTGKPILFKHCPECGKFLNGPGVLPHPTAKGATHE